jgi:phospholipid/cholesterol/gamma-HCH transport system substrate-binding protein
MNDRNTQFHVGVVVVATLLIAAILVVLFGDFGFGSKKTIYVYFDEAPGTTVNTPVRKSGILIGRVRGVEFDDAGRVQVEIQVDADVPIKHSEQCQIKNSLLGNAVLEFVPRSDVPNRDKQPLEDGESIQGTVVGDPLQMIAEMRDDLTYTVRSLGMAGEKVGGLADQIGVMLGEDQGRMTRIVAKTEIVLDGMNDALTAVNRVIGDESVQQELRQSVAELPKIIADARATIAGVQDAVETANRNLTNMEGITGPLGERGPEIVAKIETGVEDLSTAMQQLAAFSEAVNDSEGTIGQLVKNPDLYNRLNTAASNIERASQQLRPIVSDVRVFTDKIARDPSQIGVGGAIRKRTGIK